MLDEQTAVIEDTETQVDSESIQDQQEEFEIKLDSPSDDDRRKNPMVTRIIGQRNKARDENAELKQKIAELESKLTKPAQATAAPKWADFDNDEAYEKAVQDHIAQKLMKTQPKIDPVQQYQQTQRLEKGLEKHYSRANELAAKFPQYSVAEEAANTILGPELSQEIALRASNSPELMLYLGTNPSEASRFKNLAESDPVQAGIELGRLDALVKIQSKTKQSTPEPDEVLQSKAGIKKNQRGPEGATFE